MKNTDNASVQIRVDVPYGGGPQEDLCVDIYLPAGAGLHPALLCLHGGAWQHGSQRQYQSWGPWLAERGYGVVAVDYRLSSQVSPAWPGVWEDVCRSLDWLIANASSLHIDPARIATIGDSAGAHMAAMLSLHERTAHHICAVAGVYGVYDLPDWWRVTQPPQRTDDPVDRLMGKPYGEMKEDYESFSPLHRLQKMAGRPEAKYLIIYGDQDPRVPHNQSERFLSALRDKDVESEAMLIPGAGHSWFTFADDQPTRRRVDEEPNATVAPALIRFLGKMGSS
jgi:acetyl esterase/lipase